MRRRPPPELHHDTLVYSWSSPRRVGSLSIATFKHGSNGDRRGAWMRGTGRNQGCYRSQQYPALECHTAVRKNSNPLTAANLRNRGQSVPAIVSATAAPQSWYYQRRGKVLKLEGSHHVRLSVRVLSQSAVSNAAARKVRDAAANQRDGCQRASPYRSQ